MKSVFNSWLIKVEEHGGSLVECLTGDLGGCWFKPQRHCVVSLSKTLYPLLSAGSTQEDLSRHDGTRGPEGPEALT